MLSSTPAGGEGLHGRPSEALGAAGRVKLTMTLDMHRELAERLSARAIRDGVNKLLAVRAHNLRNLGSLSD